MCDNREEYKNSKKLGLKIDFGPSYLPWSNGVNERNHYSYDIIVSKILNEDRKVVHKEGVNIVAYTKYKWECALICCFLSNT